MTTDFMARFADQSHDVLAAVLEQSAEAILLLSPEGDIEYANGCAQRAFARDDASLCGSAWADTWATEMRSRVTTATDQAFRGQRGRFEAFCPAHAHGHSQWWDIVTSPITGSDGLVGHVLVTARDVTDRVQERLSDRMMREEAENLAEVSDSVAREMRHRLKNQLAVVNSVAKLLARHSDDKDALLKGLEAKLQNLAKAQDLLTIARSEPVTAQEAIAQVIEASGAGEGVHVGLLPHARLGDDAIQQLALVLGELQTNSLKYGALAADRGSIIVSGSREGDILGLRWHEDIGSPMTAPTRSGAGMTLVSRLGSAPGRIAGVSWHERGPTVEFYVKTLPN